MRKSQLDTYKSLFQGDQVYVYTPTRGGHTCDKIKSDGSGRQRYVVTAGQCTCLGWLKTSNCKHLRMLKHDFEFTKGMSAEATEAEFKSILSKIATEYPKLAGKVTTDTFVAADPTYGIVLVIADKERAGTKLVTFVKSGKGELAVMWEFAE